MEGAREGDVGAAMARAAAGSGADGAPCTWDRRAQMSARAAAS